VEARLFTRLDLSRLSWVKLILYTAIFAILWIVGCGKSSSTDTAASASPAPAASPSGASAPAGYSVALAIDTGESLVTQKSNVATVDAALLAVVPDLTAYFGSQPTIGAAYQNANDATVGGTTFTSTYKGQPICGVISCKLQNGGASISVIYDQTSAPKSDWEKLMNPPTQPTVSAASPSPSPGSGVALSEYDFPDGTGSIGIAPGWTTSAQSEVTAGIIIGPAGQAIILANGVGVQTPDSPQVQSRNQMEARWAQMNANSAARGLPPIQIKPLPPIMVAPFTDPATAVQNMVPEFSLKSVFNNGPSLTFNKIISSEDRPCQLPNGKSAIVTYSFTRVQNGQSTPYRVQAAIVVSPLTSTSWFWYTPYATQAPDATFDQDLPVMMAMINSNKVNQQRAVQVAQARNQATQQMGQQILAAQQAQDQALNNMAKQDAETQSEIHQQQQQQTQAQYDAHNQQFSDYELQRSRHAADFDESIIGTRTIYDTVTGQSGYADLSDVSGVVNSLNKAALDPNRFVQIPLRDQLAPLPQNNQ
jgi:hypothetical protein